MKNQFEVVVSNKEKIINDLNNSITDKKQQIDQKIIDMMELEDMFQEKKNEWNAREIKLQSELYAFQYNKDHLEAQITKLENENNTNKKKIEELLERVSKSEILVQHYNDTISFLRQEVSTKDIELKNVYQEKEKNKYRKKYFDKVRIFLLLFKEHSQYKYSKDSIVSQETTSKTIIKFRIYNNALYDLKIKTHIFYNKKVFIQIITTKYLLLNKAKKSVIKFVVKILKDNNIQIIYSIVKDELFDKNK
ncbi:hypothetical protein RFI_28512 [Reticulomyxa filosa]|uniref:Uncharacterized protein n=1 Tax=Reticulomyxa filosa TaxID=46433 RepID=X6M614_RETFI|nr:hypothetical protein RFI_28512 [Reticulomyxa filosa]|eukprot:ETO08882.1 hypothetical protein RFI_28512 [Reticulomyxa filosa]